MRSDFDRRCREMDEQHNAEVRLMWRRTLLGGLVFFAAAVVGIPAMLALCLWVWKSFMG